MHTKDLISGVFFLLTGLLFSWASVCIPLGCFSNPGPGLVPLFPGLVLSLLSLVLIIRSLLARRKQAEGESPQEEDDQPLHFHPMVVITLVVMLLYAFALELLGFIITSFILMLFTFKFGGALNWKKTLLGSVLAVGVCFVVFQLWLGVQFPRGPWGF